MNKKIAAQVSLAALLIVLTRADEARAQKIKERLEKKQPTDGGARSKTAIATENGGAVVHSKRQRRRRGRMRARADLYEPLILAAAERYGVDPRTLWTVIYLQTRFRAEAATTHGVARPGAKRVSPVITGAARRLKRLAERYDNRPELILASYHAGERAVDAYLHGVAVRLPDGTIVNRRERRTDDGVPPFRDTRRYVARGLSIVARVERAAVFGTKRDVRADDGPAGAAQPRARVDRVAEHKAATRPRRRLTTAATAEIPTANQTPVDARSEQQFFTDVHSGEQFLMYEVRENLGAPVPTSRLEEPQQRAIREGLNPAARVREALEFERHFAAASQRRRFAMN